MSVFLQPIYTQVVGSTPVASITFNNIPQGFQDLYFEINARTSFTSNAWDDVFVRFNNSTSGYSNTTMFMVGANNVVAGRTAGQSSGWCGWTTNANSTANTFGTEGIYIPNYSEGVLKQYFFYGGAEGNTATLPMGMQAVSWNNTDPITSLTFTSANSANFVQNTSITVYGVSNTFDTAIPAAPTLGAITDLGGVIAIGFTANDSGAGQTADTYSIQDIAIQGSPVYANQSPVVFPATTGVTYNTPVKANNSLGSSTSSLSASATTLNNLASIASYAISSSVASVSFTSIPQYYRHLMLRITAMSADTSTRQLDMGFNNDGSQIYTFHQYYASNTTVSGSTSAPRNDIPEVCIMRANNQTKPGVSYLYLFDYTDTGKFKTVHWYLGNEDQTAGFIEQATGTWRSFAPVSMISLVGRGGSIGANSHIALYGIG